MRSTSPSNKARKSESNVVELDDVRINIRGYEDNVDPASSSSISNTGTHTNATSRTHVGFTPQIVESSDDKVIPTALEYRMHKSASETGVQMSRCPLVKSVVLVLGLPVSCPTVLFLDDPEAKNNEGIVYRR